MEKKLLLITIFMLGMGFVEKTQAAEAAKRHYAPSQSKLAKNELTRSLQSLIGQVGLFEEKKQFDSPAEREEAYNRILSELEACKNKAYTFEQRSQSALKMGFTTRKQLAGEWIERLNLANRILKNDEAEAQARKKESVKVAKKHKQVTFAPGRMIYTYPAEKDFYPSEDEEKAAVD
jgi:hypothetical protein